MRFADDHLEAARHEPEVDAAIPAASNDRENIRIRKHIGRKNDLRDALFLKNFTNIVNTSENFNPRKLLTEPLAVLVYEPDHIITIDDARAQFLHDGLSRRIGADNDRAISK